MPRPAVSLTEAELQARREAIRRGLRRANSATVVVLLVVGVLALVAMVQRQRADRHASAAVAAQQAADAERDRAEAELWKSYLAQARAGRAAGLMGRRAQGLEALRGAARRRPSLELRHEAVATLALRDLVEAHTFPLPTNASGYAVHPALTQFAWCDRQGRLRLERLPERQVLREIEFAGQGGYFLRFSPGGGSLALRAWDRHVTVFDLADGTARLRWPVGEDARAAALDFVASDGSLVLATNAGTALWLSLPEGTVRSRFVVDGPIDRLVSHPREPWVALTVGHSVEVRELARGTVRTRLPHPDAVLAVAWHPQEAMLASGCDNGQVFVWDLAGPAPRLLAGHSAPVVGLAFNPDGRLLISRAYDSTTRLWDPDTGRQLLVGERGYGTHFSPDGLTLAFERPGVACGLWRVVGSTGFRALALRPAPDRNIWGVAVDARRRWLAVLQRERLSLFELPTLRSVTSVPVNQGRALAFLPGDGGLIVGEVGGVSIWPVQCGTGDPGSVARLGSARRLEVPGLADVRHLALEASGRRVAVASGPRDTWLIELAEPMRPQRFTAAGLLNGSTAAASADGRWLVQCSFHGRGTWVHDLGTGAEPVWLDGRNASAAFSPDRQWLVVAACDEYLFYRPGTWTPVRRVTREVVGQLAGHIAFDGTGALGALSKTREVLELFEPASGRTLARLTPPDPQPITCLELSADGALAVAGTGTGMVHVWDLTEVRAGLADLGLDWVGEAAPAAPEPPVGATLALAPAATVGARSGMFAGALGAAAVLAAVLAALAIRRHRRLIEGYEDIDRLVHERNRELEVARVELYHGQKMRALGNLAAGIAHDFNNLLSVVRMANKLIGRDVPTHAEVQENVAAIEHAVREGKTIVHSVLGYSREDAESEFAVTELVEDTIGLLSKQFLSGLVLTLELDRDLPHVRGSRGRLEQILLNLVVNAAEAMNGVGKLSIAVRRLERWPASAVLRPRGAPGYLELAVADSGPGIEPEVLPRIFEPFFTTKTAGTTRGTGLGLSLVHALAEQDGLGLAVRTAVGQGTTFHLILPLT